MKNYSFAGSVFFGVFLSSVSTVSAQQVDQIEVVPARFQRVGPSLDGHFEKSVIATVRRYETIYKPGLVNRLVWVCPNPKPVQGDWKGFFEVEKPYKPKALADAIKGVGLSSAKCIVENGGFSRKPRSWEEFSEEIEDDAKICRNRGLVNDVLGKYAKENMVNLGYRTASTNPDDKCYEKVIQVEGFVAELRLLDVMSRKVAVEVDGAPLLKNEVEEFVARFDGVSTELDTPYTYNRYQVKEKRERFTQTIYSLQGIRQRVGVANTLSVHPTVGPSGKLELDVTDTYYEPQFAQTLGTSLVVVEVFEDRFGPFDKKLTTIAPTKLNPNSDRTVVKTAFVVPKTKSKIFVRFGLQRIGSPFFSDQLSERKNSLGFNP